MRVPWLRLGITAIVLAIQVAVVWYLGDKYEIPVLARWILLGAVTGIAAMAAIAGSKLITEGALWKKLAFGTLVLGIGALGVWAYAKYVWSLPSVPWTWKGEEYELLSPRMLGIVLLAPYFIWFVGQSLADLPLPQRIVSVVLRVAFVALLALGLARLAKSTTGQKVCTVFLIDVSESVPEAALRDAEAEIQRTIDAKPKDDLIRIITFARRPIVLSQEEFKDDSLKAPTIKRHLSDKAEGDKDRELDSKAQGAATDIASALQLAYGLYPTHYLRRAIIMSDGVQTDGDLLAEANRARAFGVKVYTIAYTQPVPGEVAVRDLKMPDKIRAGDTFDIHANIFSSRAQKVTCTLKQGETINLDGIKQVDLKPGDNDVIFKSKVVLAGDVTYALDVTNIPDDRFKENNHYTAVASVIGRPTILYVEGNPARANFLSSALNAQEFEVVVASPREIPTSDLEFERYDFIILSDTPAEQVSLTQQDAIERYVTYLGGGFLFAGGESGYGLGGWYHTTIERILPVRMDAEKRHDEPMVAMSLVIDRSGSMSGLPLEMAKEAAKKTADTLQADDLLGVIAFDSVPNRVVRLTPARHRARIQGDISRITPGGGTEIFPALDAAYEDLRGVKAKKKHVILLTDGQAPTQGIRDVVSQMAGDGITVTSVGLGNQIDEGMLKMIAEVGQGRFYKVPDPNSLPRIFTREAELVSRSAAVEEYFQPKVVTPADFLRGIDMGSAPYLHGYVATKMKPSPAQEILTSEKDEPILARWHVGLGWTLAWTSDVKNLWAVEWLKWGQYGQFWGQLAREHMRQKKRQVLDMRAEVDTATGHVKAYIDAIGQDDKFQNDLQARFRVTGPQPNGKTDYKKMRQTAPGRYEVDFPLSGFGSFLLSATLEKLVDDGKGGLKSAQVAESFGQVTNPYPREYLAFAPDKATLAKAAEVTGGKSNPEPSEVFDPGTEVVKFYQDLWPKFVIAAIACFLLDLLVRRVRFFDRKKTAKPPSSKRAPA